ANHVGATRRLLNFLSPASSVGQSQYSQSHKSLRSIRWWHSRLAVPRSSKSPSSSIYLLRGTRSLSESRGCRNFRRVEPPSTSNWFALACTTAHAADSARTMSPSFDVTTTVIFLLGMNTASAYHIVFDPLCQYTVCGISSVGPFTTQPYA